VTLETNNYWELTVAEMGLSIYLSGKFRKTKMTRFIVTLATFVKNCHNKNVTD
jgi:hypothetical protein